MSLKKTVAIAAAAGALAAISVPAMAFENEAHGLYNLKWFISNYEAGSSSFIFPAAPATMGKKTNNYFEQRARLQYIAKASDDLKLVTHFEIDSVWGDRAQGGSGGVSTTGAVTPNFAATRGSGGAMEADAVNLETKHVFLDFKIPSTPTRMTVGIQPFKDAFKGIFLDADLAGINTVSKLGAATVGVGYFRAYDQSYFGTGRPVGADALHIGALSADFAVSKDMKVGAAYYLYADNRNDAAGAGMTNTTLNVHVLGANFDAKLGALGLSGFAAMQQGMLKGVAVKTGYSGWAFNVAAKMAAGPGTFRTAFLLTTGDDGRDGHNTAWQSVTYSQNAPNTLASFAANTYNESGMFLLNRNALSGGGGTDYSLVYTTNNRDQGVWLYTLGYDAKLGAKAYANANLGFAWASKDNGNKPTDKTPGNGQRNGSNYQGAEINIETGYKMYDNLTVKAQAAYVMLGGYYNKAVLNTLGTAGVTPADPYTFRVGMSYAF